MAMAAPAAVILKNERRLCVDTVLELFIRHSLCNCFLFSERVSFWRIADLAKRDPEGYDVAGDRAQLQQVIPESASECSRREVWILKRFLAQSFAQYLSGA